MSNTIRVAVAVIQRRDRILIAKRPQHLHKGGFWEFPGGKQENDEPISQALIRECFEELAIIPVKFSPLIQIEHTYPEKSVFLDVWTVTDYMGVPRGVEGQPLVWCPVKQLDEYQFPEANLAIVEAIRR
ncbi:8-oxo-dGTP diphosphatase MutT [Kangiella aquimarina]|uniref:8-oxo-dGTP diphosphatase n=1 Tax=Kangiella aquimarina TaxID=261965 RepID=A0ABZ0X3D8_9GAMM|nr:8-oxo-dGTP diphosphatase MutT [Kangiella aquimarina]WQG85015.1 8-oxo-dGTP diphosphatase MutT [Kangiella aquimarina]